MSITAPIMRPTGWETLRWRPTPSKSRARVFDRTSWAHAPRLRAQVLLELADAIAARRDEIAREIAIENGKVLAHCIHETNAAVSEARYYAGLARSIFGRVTEIDEGKQSIFAQEPVGVAAIIVPWNAPSTLLLRSLGPALAAGCTTVIKGRPSDEQRQPHLRRVPGCVPIFARRRRQHRAWRSRRFVDTVHP